MTILCPAKDWHIYAAKLSHQDVNYSSPATTIPIVGASHALSKEDRQKLRESGHVFDDEGKNISELNPFFCELTAIYWQIHHCNDRLMGSAHYRRKWDDTGIVNSADDVLYVKEPYCFPCSVAQQLMDCCRSFDAPKATMSLAERGLLPLTASEMEAFWSQNMLHSALMARGPQVYYKQLMHLLFDTLWPIWEENEQELRSINGYNRRMMGFIGERMMTALILYSDKFFNFPIAYSPVHLIS